MKEVKEIIRNFLIAGGYDGLYCEECGCSLEELIPCGSDFSQCKPGYFVKCDIKNCENEYCIGESALKKCTEHSNYEDIKNYLIKKYNISTDN